MRQALQDVANRPAERSIPADFPAPTQGWSKVFNVASTPVGFALTLKNFIPYPDKCSLRGGSINHTTGFTAGKEIQTLLVYKPSGAGAKMFAATDQGIFDATSAGAVGAVSSAATNGKWQWVNFANSVTSWLCCVNGADDFRHYNGTVWTTVATFGTVATNTLVGIEVYQQRLFFVKNDSRQLYYLPTGAVTGSAAASVINLEQMLRRGGYLMAIGTWTLDSGTGMNDKLVAVSSEGEVVIFSGTDPSSANTWTHEGTFFVGRPIGRRCLTKMAGDLLILTERGLFPLSQVIQSTTIEPTVALSRNIESEIVKSAKSYFSTFGWQIEIFNRDQLLIVNVPESAARQFVMQLQTKGWCEFTNLQANCWASFNGELYFGTTAKVMRAQSDTADNGSAIQGEIEYAYSRIDQSTRLKMPVMAMPLVETTGDISYSIALNSDFQQSDQFQSVVSVGGTSTPALFDTAIWDSSYYASDPVLAPRYWTTVPTKPGAFFAPRVKVSTAVRTVNWVGMQMLYKTGGLLS